MERNSERVSKWEPFPGLPRSLDTPSLLNDYDNGFRLILAEKRANGRAFQVVFEQPLAFRFANERYRLTLIAPLQAELPWPTFKIEDSLWIEWFHDQSLGIYRDQPVEHFVFIGEDIVEVLSARQPLITEIERPSAFGWQ